MPLISPKLETADSTILVQHANQHSFPIGIRGYLQLPPAGFSNVDGDVRDSWFSSKPKVLV